MRSILGTAIILAIALGCEGCGAASQKILGQPVHRQVAIMVRISRQVDLADNAGGVAELVETIEKGLKDEGLTSEVYTAADDHPPPPRIELNVLFWSERNSTSSQLRDAGSLLPLLGIAADMVGPDNRMVVDCDVYLADNGRPSFRQRFVGVGKVFGERDDAAAGGSAAAQILSKILGTPEPSTPAKPINGLSSAGIERALWFSHAGANPTTGPRG